MRHSRDYLSDTKIGYCLEKRDWFHIGNKSHWSPIGKEPNGKVIWQPKSSNSAKADPGRTFFCCPGLCNSLIVNQGAINKWFFSRKYTNIAKGCSIQKLIADFSNVKRGGGEGEKHKIAKELLFQYLKLSCSKEKYMIANSYLEKELNHEGFELRPDITLVKNESSELDFVEIVNHSSPHRNPNAWEFYRDRTEKLIIVDIKRNQRGWDFEDENILTILIEKFERSFYDRLNIIQLWEESRKIIVEKYEIKPIHFDKFRTHLRSISDSIHEWNRNCNDKYTELFAKLKLIESMSDSELSSEEGLILAFEFRSYCHSMPPDSFFIADPILFRQNGRLHKDTILRWELKDELNELSQIISDECELKGLTFEWKGQGDDYTDTRQRNGFYTHIWKGSWSGEKDISLIALRRNSFLLLDRIKALDIDCLKIKHADETWKYENTELIAEVVALFPRIDEEIEKLGPRIKATLEKNYFAIVNGIKVQKEISKLRTSYTFDYEEINFAKNYIDIGWKRTKETNSVKWEKQLTIVVGNECLFEETLSIDL